MTTPDTHLLRAMGLKSWMTVSVSAPRFVVSDMQDVFDERRVDQPRTIPVELDRGELVQVTLSLVERVTDVSHPELQSQGGVPNWRFEGKIEDAKSQFDGRFVRGYAIGNDGVAIEKVYVQLVPK